LRRVPWVALDSGASPFHDRHGELGREIPLLSYKGIDDNFVRLCRFRAPGLIAIVDRTYAFDGSFYVDSFETIDVLVNNVLTPGLQRTKEKEWP
jgi:hypothetical protein